MNLMNKIHYKYRKSAYVARVNHVYPIQCAQLSGMLSNLKLDVGDQNA
jgi:hypothetical protein